MSFMAPAARCQKNAKIFMMVTHILKECVLPMPPQANLIAALSAGLELGEGGVKVVE